MTLKNKKLLSMIVYYTLAILAVCGAGFFVYVLTRTEINMWARIVYYVWSGLLIGAVIFDIVCTITKEAKHLSAWIIYILSILASLMTMLVYLTNATRTGLVAGFFNTYLATSLISLITTGYLIATYFAGRNLIIHSYDQTETNKK